MEKIPTNWKKIRQIGKNPDKLEKKPQLQKETPLATNSSSREPHHHTAPPPSFIYALNGQDFMRYRFTIYNGLYSSCLLKRDVGDNASAQVFFNS